MNSTSAGPLVFSYARPGTTATRVAYEREGQFARVLIHRPGRRSRAARRDAALVIQPAGWLLISSGLTWPARGMLAGLRLSAAVVGFVALAMGAVYIVSWWMRARLDRALIIEVTPTEVVLSNMDESRSPMRLERSELYSIRFAGHASTLFFYRRGREMYDFPLGDEASEGEAIAAFLRDATGTTDEGGAM